MKIILSIILTLLFAFTAFSQQSDKATVYFYRVKEVMKLSNKNVKVHINDEYAFQMPQTHFIAVKLSPGDYKLKMEKKQSEMLLSVEAGKTYFVRVSQTVSGYFYNEMLTEMQEKQARFQMRELKFLPDSKLKSKTLVFVKDKLEN